MSVEVFIAKATDFMDEGVIVAWLVEDGAPVAEGQPLLELETDKAVVEVESPGTGFLRIRPGIEIGMTLPVGETIAVIAETANEIIDWR